MDTPAVIECSTHHIRRPSAVRVRPPSGICASVRATPQAVPHASLVVDGRVTLQTVPHASLVVDGKVTPQAVPHALLQC
jgi:hypothetical protein